jgi:hypothetical protein
MSHETLAILVMINNFFHDLAVGILFANVVLSLFLIRLIKEHVPAGEGVLGRFVTYSSRITWGALTFIIVGGIIRTATYRSFEWSEAAGKGQIAALIVKHIILVGCTVVGVALQIRMSRKSRDEAEYAAAGEGEKVA